MGALDTRTAWWSVAIAVAGACLLALLAPLGTDYALDTQPAVEALLARDLGAFAAQQPSMGPLSLWLRWPFAEAAAALGGGDLAIYRLGALGCLLVAAAVTAALAELAVRRGLPRREGLLLVGVLALNPVTARALELGHPEEILGGSLCLAALLLAGHGRPRAAGLVLGLAIATKQWGLLAALPVLACAPGGLRRPWAVLVPAAAVAAVAYLPMLIADAAAFAAAMERPVGGLAEMRPGNVWHLLVTQSATVPIGAGESVTTQLVPDWLQRTAHPGVALLAILVPLVALARARGEGWRLSRDRALALLALVFLLRCWLDPWNHEYYHLPMLLALGAHEVLAGRRAPVLTIVSSAVLWVLFARLAGPGTGPGIDVLYLAWALPLTGWLALAAFGAPSAATIGSWTPTTPGTRTPARGPSPRPSRSGA